MTTNKNPKNAGRKPSKEALQEPPEINQELVEKDLQAHDELGKRLEIVDQKFGDNLPYSRTRLENECQFYLIQSTQAMLELGKRLILLKEHELHGDFTESLGRIGIETRTAQKVMKAAFKFTKPKTNTLSFLDKSKLFELMTEEDEDLEALADGGTIADLTLDEVDRMSVRELKTALRAEKEKAKEAKEIADEQLLEKSDQINELDAQLKRKSKATPDEIHAELMSDVDDAFKRMTTLIGVIDSRANDLIRSPDVEEDLTHHVASQIHRLRHRLETVLSRNALMLIEVEALGDDDIDPETGKPVWMLDEE